MSQANVLGTKIDILTRDDVNSLFDKYIFSGQTHFIVTANTEMYYQASKDSQFRDILNQADLNIVDSIGIKFALGLSGYRGVDVYPGVEMAAWLINNKYDIYILGSKDEVLKKYHLPNIVGKHHGYFNEQDEYKVIMDIQQSKPQVLLVALGVGKQERWIAKYKKILNVPVIIGVGGAIDVLAGFKKRAPKWMRKAKIEWLYRLVKEPTRAARQLSLIKFLLAVIFKRG